METPSFIVWEALCLDIAWLGQWSRKSKGSGDQRTKAIVRLSCLEAETELKRHSESSCVRKLKEQQSQQPQTIRQP